MPDATTLDTISRSVSMPVILSLLTTNFPYLKDLTISGGSLMKIMAEGKLPEDFQKVINIII